MPFYEYICDGCNHEFEVFQKITAEPVKVCESCKGSDVRRIIFAPAVHYKGNGFYTTDYRDKNYLDSQKKENPSSSKKDDDSSKKAGKNEITPEGKKSDGGSSGSSSSSEGNSSSSKKEGTTSSSNSNKSSSSPPKVA